MTTEEINEQLSALVDDELRKEERGLLLRRLTQSGECRQQLGRYFLASDTLRGNLPPQGQIDLVGRVAAALEAESVSFASHRRRFLKPLAGLAVAASVSAVSLSFWTDQPQLPVTEAGPSLAGAVNQKASVAPQSVVQPQQWERLHPDVQRRMNGYLVNHSEFSAGHPIGGMLNYVRLAGQQSDAD
jgi:sigma-E factor negative regulatory protein RseA